VFGDNLRLKGGLAEYAVMPAAALARKPPGLGFVQAAAIPQSAAIAAQGTAGLTPGRRLLINGAGGGSGPFAIQLAKQLGAHVTGVDHDAKLEFMRAVGADEVIDFRRTDFTRQGRYDVIIDLVAGRSVFALRRALVRGGRYRALGGSVPALLRVATAGALVGHLTGRRLGVLAVKEGPAAFVPLTERVVAGHVTVHVDRTFSLDDTAAALAHVGEGRAQGKVVVVVDDSESR
jgi:NADPH:quinone reductase-like Zn-dependent oxidoreductase